MPNTPKFDDVAGDLRKRGEDAMQSFGRAALETGRGPMATLAGVALLGFAAGVAASLSKKAATGETDTVRRTKLFRKLDQALARHAFAEETVIYPTLSETEADPEARRLAGDHFDIRGRLHRIEALDKTDPAWSENLRGLYRAFAGHAHDEDHEVFPVLRERLSPQQNAQLTRDLAKRSARLA